MINQFLLCLHLYNVFPFVKWTKFFSRIHFLSGLEKDIILLLKRKICIYICICMHEIYFYVCRASIRNFSTFGRACHVRRYFTYLYPPSCVRATLDEEVLQLVNVTE